MSLRLSAFRGPISLRAKSKDFTMACKTLYNLALVPDIFYHIPTHLILTPSLFFKCISILPLQGLCTDCFFFLECSTPVPTSLAPSLTSDPCSMSASLRHHLSSSYPLYCFIFSITLIATWHLCIYILLFVSLHQAMGFFCLCTEILRLFGYIFFFLRNSVLLLSLYHKSNMYHFKGYRIIWRHVHLIFVKVFHSYFKKLGVLACFLYGIGLKYSYKKRGVLTIQTLR